MQLDEVIWKEVFAEKIESKHAVSIDEVEQILFGNSFFRRVEKGRIRGEDLYIAYGQTITGRYLVVFFVWKRRTTALPISARNMTDVERRYHDHERPTG